MQKLNIINRYGCGKINNQELLDPNYIKSDYSGTFISLIILISPTLNVFKEEYSLLVNIVYVTLFTLIMMNLICILTFKKKLMPIVILLLIIIFGLGAISDFGPFKAILYYMIVLYFILVNLNLKNSINKPLFYIMITCIFLSLMQLSGFFEFFYSWADYSNETTSFNALTGEEFKPFLPQMRPAGIYPAPTYLSYLMIMLTSLVLLPKNHSKSIYYFLIGCLFALSGSTLGYVLLFIALIINFKSGKIALIGWFISMILYYALLNEIFNYNYSLVDLNDSILERDMSESILTQNPILLILAASIFSLFILIERTLVNANIIPALLIIFAPILLHNVIASLIYALMLGVGISLIYRSNNHAINYRCSTSN